MNKVEHHRDHALLEKPVQKLVDPLSRFAASQVASGVLLLIAVVVALILANSEFADQYGALQHLHLRISLGSHVVDMSLMHWLNDALMVLFFFYLGLEVKRELLAGELRDFSRSSLVFCMALGGMVLPALLYLVVDALSGADAARGWGIPMATDTAFALAILAALGRRVPRVAIIMLSALAIVDDIGAVLVISVFYTDEIIVIPLIYAALSFALLLLLNLSGFRRPVFYLLAGVSLWWWILQSGIHATTAGVLAALTVPSRAYVGTRWFTMRMPRLVRRFASADDPDRDILEHSEQRALLHEVQQLTSATVTPLQRWETALEKPVMLGVVPVFAFLNAGIALPESVHTLFDSGVAMAVALALVLGKVIGVSFFAWLGLRLGIAHMPRELHFQHIIGLGFLAGIGFTMSLFISGLAFSQAPALAGDAKLGILLGSLVAAIAGTSVLIARRVPEE